MLLNIKTSRGGIRWQKWFGHCVFIVILNIIIKSFSLPAPTFSALQQIFLELHPPGDLLPLAAAQLVHLDKLKRVGEMISWVRIHDRTLFMEEWEPWSRGYGRRLMFLRLWVWIPALYTGWTFFTFICCKNLLCFYKKTCSLHQSESTFCYVPINWGHFGRITMVILD